MINKLAFFFIIQNGSLFFTNGKAKNNKTKHISRISRIFISHKTIVVTVVQRRNKFKENIEIDRDFF